jgi:hypothetical protein
VKLMKNGGTSANKNSGGGTHLVNGVYALTFDATDTATVGELSGSIVVAGAAPVYFKFWVLEEAIYDSLFGAAAAGFDAAGKVLLQATQAGVTIPTVTTLTGHTAQTGDAYARLGAPVGASISADIAAAKANLVTIIASIGAFTGTGINTILGFFKALMKKDASATPSDVGGTYDNTTDSLEAQKDGGATLSDLGILNSTTIAALSSQTVFTLTAGSADNSAYVGCQVVITDSVTAVQKALGTVSAYVGSTKQVTLSGDPGIFTMAVGDGIVILPPAGAAGSAPTAAAIRAEMDSNSTQLAKLGTPAGASISVDIAAVKTETALIYSKVDTEVAAILAAVDTEVAAIKARTDNLPADPADASDISAAISALNNISSAQVLAQVNAALDTAIAELAADPTATPTVRTALMLLFMNLRNASTTTASTQTIKNSAGSTVLSKALSDDGTTFTAAKVS